MKYTIEELFSEFNKEQCKVVSLKSQKNNLLVRIL